MEVSDGFCLKNHLEISGTCMKMIESVPSIAMIFSEGPVFEADMAIRDTSPSILFWNLPEKFLQ